MDSLLRLTCCTPKCDVISEGKRTVFVWKPKPRPERALRLHTRALGNLVKISLAGESMWLFKGMKSQLLMQLLNVQVIAIIWKVHLEDTPTAEDASCWLFVITTRSTTGAEKCLLFASPSVSQGLFSSQRRAMGIIMHWQCLLLLSQGPVCQEAC